ncbi:MAG TPA: ribonuclease P protein component [Candidatus Saccharimonadales bacterium]
MLAQKYRFHGHGSLRYVYRNGKTARTRTLTLRYSENPHRKRPRIAVIVAKKVLKSAVKRNRVRRRVYEIIRYELPSFTKNFDVALTIFSAELLTMPADELRHQVRTILQQAEIIPGDSPERP